VPLASVAVRWILDTLPESVVITGVKNPKQAEDNALAFAFRLTKDEQEGLERVSRR